MAASLPICGYCQSAIESADQERRCPACTAMHHDECWCENVGCATYGCTQGPEVEPRRPIEIPISFWGQDHKQCPSCGREIVAAAVRCRHCGVVFDSARPESAKTFLGRARTEARLPAVRRAVVVCLVLCLVPCLAPLGAIAGAAQLHWQRAEIERLPSIYRALVRLGIRVAVVQTAALVIVLVLFESTLRR